MLLKITPNKIIFRETFEINFSHNHSKPSTPTRQSLQNWQTIMQFLHFTVLFSVKYLQLHFTQYLCNSKIFALNTVFNMGNKNRRSMRVESQLSDNRPSTSNSENRCLRRKHASNNEIDNDKNQDNRFQSSEIQEADDHIMTGGLGIADYHIWDEKLKFMTLFMG